MARILPTRPRDPTTDSERSAHVTAPALFHALPKALLHEHLDGGLRPATLLELARARGLALPIDDAGALGDWMHANANSGRLERYLRGFALTVGAMATPEACERVAFEAAEDARLDGCVLAEFRMAPLLLEPHGLRGEAVVEALAASLARSGLRCGLIVCARRTDSPDETLRTARLAARCAGNGVIGFDLAGAERGFPPSVHGAAFARARDAGLGLTCRAGESDAGSRVLEAATLGATRIGHGVHIMAGATAGESARWVDAARALGLQLRGLPEQQRPHRRIRVAGGASDPRHGRGRPRGLVLDRQPADVGRHAQRRTGRGARAAELEHCSVCADDARRRRRVVPAERRVRHGDAGDDGLGRGDGVDSLGSPHHCGEALRDVIRSTDPADPAARFSGGACRSTRPRGRCRCRSTHGPRNTKPVALRRRARRP